jgi:hypothetical protein
LPKTLKYKQIMGDITMTIEKTLTQRIAKNTSNSASDARNIKLGKIIKWGGGGANTENGESVHSC